MSCVAKVEEMKSIAPRMANSWEASIVSLKRVSLKYKCYEQRNFSACENSERDVEKYLCVPFIDKIIAKTLTRFYMSKDTLADPPMTAAHHSATFLLESGGVRNDRTNQ
jgi:hypothetical protein